MSQKATFTGVFTNNNSFNFDINKIDPHAFVPDFLNLFQYKKILYRSRNIAKYFRI